MNAQQVEDGRLKRRVHEVKKPKTVDHTSSSSGRGSFGVQNRLKFKRHSVNSTSLGNLNAKVNKFGPRKGNNQNFQ